jgi:hypothetical protein
LMSWSRVWGKSLNFPDLFIICFFFIHLFFINIIIIYQF